MNSAKSDEVRRRLIELLQAPDGVQRVFLVSGAKTFKAMIDTGAKSGVQRMSTLGNIAVLVLSDTELAGIESGVYDPDGDKEGD